MKMLPNILSVLRILLSFLLLMLGTLEPEVFITLYALCGITDIADGYVARKLKVETTLGAKLDSVGDIVFWAVVLVVFFFLSDIYVSNTVLFFVVVVALVRLFNVIMTKAKFKQWGILHTLGNKAAGFALYTAIPLAIAFAHIPSPLVVVVIAIALASAVEETCILLTSRQYKINQKSIFLP
ncbi:MAG: CDP-alcohol phosphatidyltransferase family protein [Bacillus sp. (in: firmicutes)]